MARYFRRSRGGYGRRRYSGFRRSFRRFRTRVRTVFRTRYRRGRTRTRLISRPQGMWGTIKYLVVILLIILGSIYAWNKWLKGKIIKV